ncbi:LppX_LprAFG lipoprotein [Streptomyces sp. Tu 3180]|uniref:LppX_LprAFG lipoprotein n=1 Tax=Streptomyces sp. Tu 3180 TaxID=2682611 RepID=UPI001AA05AE7|nr:LppX_LprAFG lipoprotein [Streptomyces sp. Tu 3180]
MGISARGSVPRGATSAAFAAVLLAGGTVACGEGPVSDSAKEGRPEVTPAAAVAKAARNSEDIASLRYRITGTVPERGRLEAEASMRTEPPAMSMQMTTAGQGEDGRLEIRFVDEVMYVGGSAVAPEKLDGRSWYRADPAVWGRGAVDNDSHGVLPSQLEGNPAVQSTLLTGSKDLRKKGTETIDGTRTTHYRGTVTSSGLRAARGAAADQATQERRIESLDQFIALHIDDTLTMDLWIDDDNHTKRFRMRGDAYDARGGAGGEPLDLTITFLDVNQPVTIAAPPSEDTADIAAPADEAPAG